MTMHGLELLLLVLMYTVNCLVFVSVARYRAQCRAHEAARRVAFDEKMAELNSALVRNIETGRAASVYFRNLRMDHVRSN